MVIKTQGKHRKIRVAICVSHPIQYLSPLFRDMAGECELKVFYCSDASVVGNIDKGFGHPVKWDVPLLEGYKCEFLKNYSWRKCLDNRFLDLINPGIISRIIRGNFDVVVVNGWSYFSILAAIAAARISGKKVWMRAENPLNQEHFKSPLNKFLKRIFFQFGLFRQIDKLLYIGSENKAFYKHYGVSEKKLIYAPYTVDNSFFKSESQKYGLKRQEMKAGLNIPMGYKVIVFSGKYIRKKRPLDLLRAFRQLQASDVALVMVGDGELKSEIKAYIKENRLRHVYLTGFVNQTEIPKYYALADVFVMCSGKGETWGLSVNEAMNFGKPVLVSRTCGCSSDLVLQGINGYVFEEGNIDQLAKYLRQVLSDDDWRNEAGKKSLEIIDHFSNKCIIENMKKAVN